MQKRKEQLNMSVRKDEQNESCVKFVENAKELYKLTLKYCFKMPKRYTYLVLKDILELSGELLDYVKKGNSVFPKSGTDDYFIRREYLVKARSSAQALNTRWSVLLECPFVANYEGPDVTAHITYSELTKYAKLLDEEIISINKILKDDENRFLNKTRSNNSKKENKNKIKTVNELDDKQIIESENDKSVEIK